MTKTRELAHMIPSYADAALIYSQNNRKYFTGFVSSLGYLLVTKRDTYLFVDFRYAEAARAVAKNCKVVQFRKFNDSLKEIIEKENLRVIMLESSAFTFEMYNSMEDTFKLCKVSTIKNDELDRIIAKMRGIKTEQEIELMQKATNLTEEALTEILKKVEVGVCERELALFMEMYMRQHGAVGVAFDLIIISGKKTSMPHGVPDDKKLEYGDLITLDIGADVEGYKSDMTRTVALGAVSDYQAKVYDVVKTAQQAALDKIKSGVSCGEVDRTARDIIYKAGFEGCFGHATGHGVGLDIHEKPSLSPNNCFKLESGMVVTSEPGIYLDNEFGVRIEDMVLVTDDGYKNFNSFTKDLIILGN